LTYLQVMILNALEKLRSPKLLL